MKNDSKPAPPQQQSGTSAALVEEVDFYLENGLFVFTAHYHQKRGYCCQSGCRHCPYGFKKKDVSAKESKK